MNHITDGSLRQHYSYFSPKIVHTVTKKTTQNQTSSEIRSCRSQNFFHRALDFQHPFVRMREFSDGYFPHGRVAERSNAPDSKSGIRLYRIEGSNPSPSAREDSDMKSQTALSRLGFFVFGDVIPQKNGRLAEPVGELTDSAACLFGELDSLLNRFIR